MNLYAATLALLPLVLRVAAPGEVPTVLAIIHTESRGQAGAVKREANGTCSAGLGGINGPCDAPVLDPEANVRAIVRTLRAGRTFCAKTPKHRVCRAGALGAYNNGSAVYVKRVKSARRAILLELARRRR